MLIMLLTSTTRLLKASQKRGRLGLHWVEHREEEQDYRKQARQWGSWDCIRSSRGKKARLLKANQHWGGWDCIRSNRRERSKTAEGKPAVGRQDSN